MDLAWENVKSVICTEFKPKNIGEIAIDLVLTYDQSDSDQKSYGVQFVKAECPQNLDEKCTFTASWIIE
jgi:hypothetical protein